MTLAPFYTAPDFVKIHLIGALIVTLLTPLQFWGFRKGSMPHRITGYVWLAAMLAVAISSFWINALVGPNIAGFGIIHLLSVMALFSVVRIIQTARAGQMIAHYGYVRGLSIGFFVAGIFTFVPPRLMARMFGLG
jgi:uncharacterized membrane protein